MAKITVTTDEGEVINSFSDEENDIMDGGPVLLAEIERAVTWARERDHRDRWGTKITERIGEAG